MGIIDWGQLVWGAGMRGYPADDDVVERQFSDVGPPERATDAELIALL